MEDYNSPPFTNYPSNASKICRPISVPIIQATSIFRQRSMALRERLMAAQNITGDILSLIRQRQGLSLLPTELNSTNSVLTGVIGLLEESLESSEDTGDLSNTVS